MKVFALCLIVLSLSVYADGPAPWADIWIAQTNPTPNSCCVPKGRVTITDDGAGNLAATGNWDDTPDQACAQLKVAGAAFNVPGTVTGDVASIGLVYVLTAPANGTLTKTQVDPSTLQFAYAIDNPPTKLDCQLTYKRYVQRTDWNGAWTWTADKNIFDACCFPAGNVQITQDDNGVVNVAGTYSDASGCQHVKAQGQAFSQAANAQVDKNLPLTFAYQSSPAVTLPGQLTLQEDGVNARYSGNIKHPDSKTPVVCTATATKVGNPPPTPQGQDWPGTWSVGAPAQGSSPDCCFPDSPVAIAQDNGDTTLAGTWAKSQACTDAGLVGPINQKAKTVTDNQLTLDYKFKQQAVDATITGDGKNGKDVIFSSQGAGYLCQSTLTKQDPPPSPPKPEEKKSTWWIYLLVILGIILVAGAAYYLYTRSQASKLSHNLRGDHEDGLLRN